MMDPTVPMIAMDAERYPDIGIAPAVEVRPAATCVLMLMPWLSATRGVGCFWKPPCSAVV